jgi:hypothetical protein
MKLRIQGNSLRLRVGPSEVQQLLAAGRVVETIHFAPGAHLSYALQHSAAADCIAVTHALHEVTVIVPTSVAQAWADGEEVGIYAEVPNGSGSLSLAIEKDFACLDAAHVGNRDTYPNPKAAC